MDEWARPDELDVFATGDTTVIAPWDDPASHALADAVRRGTAAVFDLHARPGYRPGVPIATSSGRRGGDADIVRPVLVDPRLAASIAGSGALFDEPVDGLDIDRARADTSRRYLVWTGRLTGEHVAGVPIALHLLASPSMVVTVVEMVPQRRLRWNRRGFVLDGVAAIEVVAARLTALAARPVGAAPTIARPA